MKLNVFLLIIISVFGISMPAYSICPSGTLNVQETSSGGLYVFNLSFDYSGTSLTYWNLSEITFDFGDGSTFVWTPTTTSLTPSVNHFYYSSGNYSITSSALFLDGTSTCTTTNTASLAYDAQPHDCPLITFAPQKEEASCADGTFSLKWSFCDYNVAVPGYWSVDSTIWSIGNGISYVSYGSNNYNSPVFNVNSPGLVTITAMAYFTGLNGEKCENSLVWCTSCSGTEGPCSQSLNDGNTYVNYYNYTPPLAQPDPQPSSAVICAGVQFTIADFGNLTAVSTSGATYSLTRNDTLVQGGSGIPAGGNAFYTATISNTGQYVYELTYNFSSGCSVSSSVIVEVVDCGQECSDCNTFKPYPGEDYWVSAWVKENQSSAVKAYSSSKIRITYYTPSGSTYQDFTTSGELIDGWQRIVGKFEIPSGTTDIQIALMNNSGVDAYFDDIRIHPYNASMKSYVYDPETLWLTAELDDNNYATFYEYDKEGQLIRIKKETSRGVMTIQESRSNNPKKE